MATTELFDAPSSGVKISEFDGALLLVTPTATETGVQTAYGPADSVIVDLAVLDGPRGGETHDGVRVWQKALQGQLRPKVGTGRPVLGRLGKGTAKPGQSAPWVLSEASEGDKARARAYLTPAPPF